MDEKDGHFCFIEVANDMSGQEIEEEISERDKLVEEIREETINEYYSQS